ncbi:hypothetical protein MnTg02_01355 [bacterium MnTg02]|nr:hypothetical protein MnTg02_01355 [bacterium MnTg02]
MNKTKSKIGRPTLDAEGPRGSKIAFRPKKSVREYLENQVTSDKSISIGTAINEAIDRARMTEEEHREQLYRNYGGKHTTSLAWLLARVAVEVEFSLNEQRENLPDKPANKREPKKWTDDPEALFLILMIFGSIVRQFFPRDWFAEDLDMLSNDGSKGYKISSIYNDAMLNFESALERPDYGFWPLSHAEPALPGFPGYSSSDKYSIFPIKELVEFLSSQCKRSNRAHGLDGHLSRIIAAQEVSNLVPFVDQIGFEPLCATQKEVEESNGSWDDLSHNDVVELAAKHGDQLAKTKTSSSGTKRKRSTKQKKGH